MAKKDLVVHKKAPAFDPTAPVVVEGAPEPKVHGKLKLVPLAEIFIDQSWNSRSQIDFQGSEFVDLREAIRIDGLKTAIALAPHEDPGGKFKYRLVAGFRRTHACMQLGHEAIPAIVDSYESDADALIANTVENTHRSGLKPSELAIVCHRLKRDHKMANVEIARRLQVSESWVSKLTKIMELPPKIVDSFKLQTSAGTVEEYYRLTTLTSKEEQLEAFQAMSGGNPSTKPDKSSSDDGEKDKKAKPVKAEALRRFLAELKNAETIRVKNEEIDMTEELIAVCSTVVRWALGDLKKYPLTLPPEDVE